MDRFPDNQTNIKGERRYTFAFVSVDAHGHINSLMGLADQLRELGHETIFICADSDVPMKRGYKMFHLNEKELCDKNNQQSFDSEAAIFCSSEFNEKFADLVTRLAVNMNKRERLCEGLIKNYDVTAEFYEKDLISLDEKLEKILVKIKPDLCFMDMVTPFPCVYKLATNTEYARQAGLQKALLWCTFMSCNPMQIYHSYDIDNFPPPLMNLPVDKLSKEEVKKELEIFDDCMRKSKLAKYKRHLAIKGGLPNADQLSEHEIWFGKFAMNISPWFNIYMFPRILDYAGAHGVYLPKDEWLQIDSFIRQPMPEESDVQDQEFFNHVQRWRNNKQLKVIYISLGTTISLYLNILDAIMQQVFTCLKQNPNWNFLMPLGIRSAKLPKSTLEEAKEWEQKDRMISRVWLPQPSLLSKSLVDVVVTHGGNNTICEIFQYKVPHVVVISGIGDQMDNARRVSDLELGVGLGAADFIEPDVDDELLCKSIDRSLSMTKIEKELTKYEDLRDAKLCAEIILSKLANEV